MKKNTLYKISGLLFVISGFMWNLAGLINSKISPNIPIGMMNICIGMMFFSIALQKDKKNKS